MPNLLIYAAEFCDRLGLAWWIEIKTSSPACIYYFGPFLTPMEAQAALPGYIKDLEAEQPQNLSFTIQRCQPSQLTVCW